MKSYRLPEYSVGGVSTPFLKMRSAEYSNSLRFKKSYLGARKLHHRIQYSKRQAPLQAVLTVDPTFIA